MRRTTLFILLPFLFLIHPGFGQEDCFNGIDDDGDGFVDLNDPEGCLCEAVQEGSEMVVNGDFESYDDCPLSFGNYQEVTDWYTPNDGSPEYFNTCGFMGGVVLGNPPEFPDGEGCVGVADGSDPLVYKEFIGHCLAQPLLPGVTYTFSFDVASSITIANVEENSIFDFGLYGTPTCENEWPTQDCPTNSNTGYVELVAGIVPVTTNSWSTYSFTFTPDQVIDGIAFGPGCTPQVPNTVFFFYYFVDNISIISGETPAVEAPEIIVNGNDCVGFTLNAIPDTFDQIQWFLDGVAMEGENTGQIEVPPGTLGTYQVGVIEGSCDFSDEVLLLPEPDITVTSIFEPIPCSDSTTTVNLQIEPPGLFSYQWSTGTDIPNPTVGEGSYSVTVTDTSGCQQIYSFDVPAPPPVFGAIDVVQPVDPISNYGVLQVIEGGGTPDYTFLWDNGIESDLNDLANPGVNTVTITDINGCETVVEYDLQPAPLLLEYDLFNNLCFNSCEGQIELFVYGGVKPYIFQWGHGPQDSVLNNLCADIYSVVIQDDEGNSLEQVFEITQPLEPEITATIFPIACSSNGLIIPEIVGLNDPLIYNWSTGSENDTLFPSNPGTYVLTVTDLFDCTIIDTFTVTSETGFELSVLVDSISCPEGAGSVEVSIIQGTEPFEILWSDADTGLIRDSLVAGSYTFTVTDGNGCAIIDEVILSEPAPVNVVFEIDSIRCFNSVGSIVAMLNSEDSIIATGWSNGFNGPEIIVPAGIYGVEIETINGCIYVDTISLENPDSILINYDVIPASCLNAADGEIELSILHGIPPYEIYLNGILVDSLTHLVSGSYNVEVIDSFGCAAATSIDIPFLSIDISYEVEVGQPSCSISNGTIRIIADSMTYDVLWNDGVQGQFRTDLPAGEYIFTIFDSIGCGIADTVALRSVTSVFPGAMFSPETCNGLNDGEIAFLSIDGSFSYSWPDGSDLNARDDLAPGTYNVTVTDTLGCDSLYEIDILPGIDLTVNVVIDTPQCPGENVMVNIIPNNGLAPYNFIWNDQEDAQVRNLNSAGNYSVLVSDSIGCTDSVAFNIGYPDSIKIDLVELINPNILNGESGSIEISVDGGRGALDIQWSNAATGLFVEPLPPGIYFVTVTDELGCNQIVEFELQDQSNFTFNVFIIDSTCEQTCEASANVMVEGLDDFSIIWSDGIVAEERNDLCAQAYSVYLEIPTLGRIDSISFVVGNYPDPTYEIEVQDESCVDFDDGIIDIFINTGDPIEISWANDFSGFFVQNVPPGIYSFELINQYGCVVADSVIVESKETTDFSYSVRNATCLRSGYVALSEATDGFFTVSGNALSDTLFLNAGSYYIEEIVSANCTLTVDSFTIESAPSISVAITPEINELIIGENVMLQVSTSDIVSNVSWLVQGELLCGGDIADCELFEFTALDEGSYLIELLAENEDGCQAGDQMIVRVIRPTVDIYVPTAFSPNDDGVNDVFRPFFVENSIEVLSFQIYNRWGGMVYEYIPGTEIGWNGKFNDEKLDNATFVYVLETIDFTGEKSIMEGSFHLIR